MIDAITAIKRTIRQHFVAGLLSDIKSQINAKLQSMDTKEKLLNVATEIEAAVRPKSSASAQMALGAHQQEEENKLHDLKAELDAIKSRFGNLNLLAREGRSSQEAPHGRQFYKPSGCHMPGSHVHRREGRGAQAVGLLHQVQTMGPPLPR